MKKKGNKIQNVPIETLIDNPNIPNRMGKSTFAKLVRNIERTRLYEPIIVRNKNNMQNSEHSTQYEIINGHHRVKALKQLGYTNVDICVWDTDDQQTDILLATLNRLSGSDSLEKKLALINRLSDNMQAKELSQLLPLTSGQIERYCNLELPKSPAKADTDNLHYPIFFFVSKEQKKTIEDAIQKMQNAGSKPLASRKKSEAITQIAESFNKSNKSTTKNTK